ncbi:MAG: SpoIIIAH-like family protein [Firmicutes bacterium]|nr:SpoIIIAH-like family protein [Bacillota bacterium]
MGKKKKIFVLVGMVALLVITGVLNIVLNRASDRDDQVGGVVQRNYFEMVRADNLAVRQETLMFLQAVIEAGGEGRADAEAQKLAITSAMIIEDKLEGQIRALGHNEVLVTASGHFITVILRANDLTDIQVAQITRIITSNTDRTPSNIRIMEIE